MIKKNPIESFITEKLVERAGTRVSSIAKAEPLNRVDVEEKTASRAQLGVETVRGMGQATRLAA